MIGCLMIHGYTGGPYEVQPLANYLQQHTEWDIKVPTLPGHGKALQLQGITYDQWIETAEKELQRLLEMHENVYIIGFSMGGMIAAYLTAKYSVDKLVLLAAARKYISFQKLTLEIGSIVGDTLRGELAANEFFANFVKKRADVPLRSNIEFAKLVRFTTPYVRQVTAPVLMAHGRQDTIVPIRSIHQLNKDIPSEQKELVLFDASDHHICLGSDRDILNMIVYDFLTFSHHHES